MEKLKFDFQYLAVCHTCKDVLGFCVKILLWKKQNKTKTVVVGKPLCPLLCLRHWGPLGVLTRECCVFPEVGGLC